MGLFTGIGDFFRGAFGEDENEKRRRKQREAQQAAQRQAQQQAAQQKVQKQQVQTVGDLFGQKQANPVAPAQQPKQQLQQTKPTAAPVPTPQKQPIPAPVVQPQSPLPAKDVTVQKIVNANPNGNARQVQRKTTPIVPGSAQDKKNRVITSVAASPARVLTGLAQGVTGLYDLVTPGKGNSRATNALNKSAEEMDTDVKKEGYDKLYKTLNVPLEIGTYFIPTTVASKIASKIPKATKLTTDIAEKAANLVDDAGDANRVRQALAEGVRKGMTLEQALADNAINLKYTGEQTAHGEKVTPQSIAENAALGVAGGTAPAAIKRLFKGKADLIPEEAAATATAAIKEGGNIVEPWYKKAQQATVDDMRTARELGEDPRFGKKEMSEAEQKYRDQQREKRSGEPTDTPTFAREGKEAYDKAAGEYIRKNGILTDDEYEVRLRQAKAQISKEEAQVRSGLIKITNQEELEAFKKRQEDMLEAIETHKRMSDEAVANAKAHTDETIETGQKAAADAKAVAEAKVNPAPEKVVQAAPKAANPETQANNAYQPESFADVSTRVVKAIGEDKELKRGNFLYNNRLTKFFNKKQQDYIEWVDKQGDKITDKTQAAIASDNAFNRGAAELPRMFFKNFGQKKEAVAAMIKRTSHMQNSGRIAVSALKTMEDAVKDAGNPQEVYERIYRVLETPEYLQRRYGDATKLTPADLTPQERKAFDTLVEINKIRNDVNFQTGLINAEQHAAYADGMHAPRIYDIEVQYPQLRSARGLDLNAAKKRKDLEDIPDYIFDESIESPFQASALRLESALKNKAHMENLQNLDAIGGLPTSAPNKNFTQLKGKKYGQYEGRYIDKQILSQVDGRDYYNSDVGQAAGDLINKFHNSALGAPGRAYKKFRTTLSPGTIVGNIGSGQLAFSKAANINPLTSMFRTLHASKQLNSKGINPYVQEAELAGLFAGDTGRMINNTKQAESAIQRDGQGNVIQKGWDKAGSFYGGIDRATALGWYNEFRARGLSPEQAVSRVHLGMQNYGNAGRVVGAAADSPLFGKPFARFTPELLRIAKNAAVYNPVGTAASAAGLYAGANKLSDMAGETPEERKAREEAPGQTKINIPFTDKGVSLNIPVGDSSVNIARAIGLNFPQEPNGSPDSAIIKQLNPFADPTRTNAQGEQVIAPNQLVGDMFYRQIADQIADRDFMGRQITDPDNKTYYEDGDASIKKFPDDLSANEKLKNRARSAVMGLPFAPELDNIISSATGNEDYYDKTRTIPEAIGRLFGVKVESNSQEVRDKRTATNRFFDEDLPAVQKFVQENPDLAQKYYQIKNPTRTRPKPGDETGTKTSDLITPEKWDIINSDTSGRLFNFLKSQDERLHARSVAENAKDPKKKIKPIDPIYELPADQAKYVAELRSRPSGDDIEAQEILRATSDWYKAYEDKYHDYLNKNSEYYDSQPEHEGAAKDNPRVKEYGDVSPPIEQPPIIKEYYKIKESDPERAKEIYKANKEVLSAAFDSYAKDRLDRINKMRKIEGYDPISLETYKNKTFGFTADDGKGSGYGSGGGGRRGSGTPDVNALGEMTNFTKGVDAIAPIEAQAMPQLVAMFNALKAGSGGGRNKPKVGASSTGR